MGFSPQRKRLLQLALGCLMAALCCLVYFGAKTVSEKSSWTVNENYSGLSLLKGAGWIFNSVMFEELIFRGALLYIAIKRMGVMKACLLSAICFGIYHWFSFNVFGNPVNMAIIFFMTALWGFMFAMSFARTGSLYLPVGLHFGWNFMATVFFSNGPLGSQFLMLHKGIATGAWPSLCIFSIQLFLLPLLVFFYLRKK